jgi:hypothetical protein
MNAAHYLTQPTVKNGTPWRLAVVDGHGGRTLQALFFADGQWNPGTYCTAGGEPDSSGPYGIPSALRSLYTRERYPIEAALQRKAEKQENLCVIEEMDAEARRIAIESANLAAIERAARAQALEELDTAAAIKHGAGDDLPLFAM